ncbi:NB-ARC domain-containing protein [Nocardia sp. NPDC004068]|uniref:NB-ARC domain-containing protein n=1 Tax=Nocardia sp. NPDC004068 TaxID=3364303 RepID=UPI0036C8AAB5
MAEKELGAEDADALFREYIAALSYSVLRAEKVHGSVNRGKVAKRLSVSAGSVYAYLKGTTLPKADIFDKLLAELKVEDRDAARLVALRDRVEIAKRSVRDKGAAAGSPGANAPDLPRDIVTLVGRELPLTRILTALGGDPGEGVACVVSGLGGIGKTALAVRAARRLQDRFPDGRLFVDMRGYATDVPVTAADAARKLLRQSGIAARSIPADADEAAALLREQLRGRRILLILDNVVDTDQIRPLLPAEGPSRVLITSRSNLNGLDDAVHVRLDALSARQSAGLIRELTQDLSPEHRPSDRQLAEIARQCHGLPMAIRIAAALVRSEPWPTTEPTDGTVGIEVFYDGDRDLEDLFEHSVRRLDPEQAQVFTLLGAHVGFDFDPAAAAATAGVEPAAIRKILRHLVEVNLLESSSAARYGFHDLVRAFVRRRATARLARRDLDTATARVIEHYLARADAADRVLTPHRHRVGMTPAPEPAERPDYDTAKRWMSAERDNMIAAARAAHDLGRDEQCWQLAFALRGHAFITNDIELWATVHRYGMSAARRAGNRYAEAVMRNNLGLALLRRGEHAGAEEMYVRARELFAEVGDGHGEHIALAHHAWVHVYRGELDEALRKSLRALAYIAERGSVRNHAILMRDTASIEIALDRHAEAVPRLIDALELFATHDLRIDEAMTCTELGEAYRRLAAFPQAHAAFERAVDVGRAAGSVLEESRGHEGLGLVAVARDDPAAAHRHLLCALAGYSTLHDMPGRQRVLAELERLGPLTAE